MCSKLLDLRPDRSLLNSGFDGYKLSLTDIPTSSHQLLVPVDHLLPDLDQYTLLHAKLFVLHNHLVGDPDEESAVYFIDESWIIQRFCFSPDSDVLENHIVWQIPRLRVSKCGDYNTSLRVHSNFMAVSDGMGFLYVLNTTQKNGSWTKIFNGEVVGPDKNFIIIDLYHKVDAEGKDEINLLLLSVKTPDSTGIATEKNSTILHWVTLEKSDMWNQVAIREIKVKGFVQYCNLERPACGGIYIISESGSEFTLDSENAIIKKDIVSTPGYTWRQTSEDITLNIPLAPDYVKSQIDVKTENLKLEIKAGVHVLLSGTLCRSIDSNLTTWEVQNDNLEVALHKSDSGLWDEVVAEGVHRGEYVVDPEMAQEVGDHLETYTSSVEIDPPTGTTFNSQQVEDCDFESDKLTIFERLSLTNHEVTHKINLGSHQVLTKVQLDSAHSQAIGVRSDVDVCIWQPTKNDEFTIEHKGTLLALGYIQASKQQMKFFVCSPDMSYSTICESTRHIFIYCQKKAIADSTELRNRSTGQRFKTLAQQLVYSLPLNEEILGVYAANSRLFVLGKSFLNVLKL